VGLALGVDLMAGWAVEAALKAVDEARALTLHDIDSLSSLEDLRTSRDRLLHLLIDQGYLDGAVLTEMIRSAKQAPSCCHFQGLPEAQRGKRSPARAGHAHDLGGSRRSLGRSISSLLPGQRRVGLSRGVVPPRQGPDRDGEEAGGRDLRGFWGLIFWKFLILNGFLGGRHEKSVSGTIPLLDRVAPDGPSPSQVANPGPPALFGLWGWMLLAWQTDCQSVEAGSIPVIPALDR
jgi:hypothetical protein